MSPLKGSCAEGFTPADGTPWVLLGAVAVLKEIGYCGLSEMSPTESYSGC